MQFFDVPELDSTEKALSFIQVRLRKLIRDAETRACDTSKDDVFRTNENFISVGLRNADDIVAHVARSVRQQRK